MAKEVETGRIIAAYLKIRNEKHAYKRAADAVLVEYEAKLKRLGAELLDRMNKQKVKNIASDMGTAVRVKQIIPRADDWDRFYRWISENDAFEALERRVKRTFIQDYMEENKGAIPPGISVMTSFEVVVKKAPSKKGIPDAEE